METNTPDTNLKLRRGRISLDRKKEILEQYDLLSKPCTNADAAAVLGVTEATLSKILAERDGITEAVTVKKDAVSRKREASCDGDNSEGVVKLRRGRLSFEKQKELLARYDELDCSHSEAANELGIKEGTLTKLLSNRRMILSGQRKTKKANTSSDDEPSGQSPQPGPSGVGMSLRKGRRVKVDFSDEEQSGSSYRESDSTEDEEIITKTPSRSPRKKKVYSSKEKQRILAKYDSIQPCSQWRAAQILGITQPTLSTWLQRRTTKPKAGSEEDSNYCEEIDSFVMGSSKGSQVIQFFEVAEERGKSNGVQRKPHMTLREKFELYRTYDSMDPEAKKNAAVTFNLNRSTWFNLITNRCYYEQRFKMKLRKDMEALKKYDELETKKNAAKLLGLPPSKLLKLLANRVNVERYYAELHDDSVSLSVEEDTELLKSVETKLLEWFRETNEGIVNWNDLKYKAKELADELGIDGFVPTDAWLRKWNRTHRVFWSQKGKLVTIYGFGENRSVSECLLTALKDYPPENVFSLVESGLYYKAVPGYTPATDDWVTVTFACNMSGAEKKKLVVVGKSEAPLLFLVMALPLVYKYSSRACMTEELFTQFLLDWDQELAESKRKIAVVLNSSSSHSNVQLDNIRLFFVPVDSSKALPLNDGVIDHAKALFRKRMAETLQALDKSTRSTAEDITTIDALFALADAWKKVPKSLLVSRFLKATFPQNELEEPDKDGIIDEELERFSQLDDQIPIHSASGGLLPCLKFSDEEISELEGGRVVHVEGTLHLSDEEEGDFDIDSLLHDQDPSGNSPPSPTNTHKTNVGSRLKNFLSPTRNGSHTRDGGAPTANEVRGALATIKKFLQINGGTLEDLTDYTQLESKLLSKINSMTAASDS